MKTALVCLGIALVCPAGLLAQHTHSPYAGDRTREIKALSAQELEAYLKGEGMGMALPAELNSYPGPRHVLELAEELGLSVEQEEATRRIYASMESQAIELGAQIVDLERRLDHQFAMRTITPAALDSLTSEIAELRGRLRAVHLRAHIQVAEVVSEAQREKYDWRRGYGGH